jgi:hypothetical protein
MISPEARERLASHMDDRRLELGLRWRDVAEAGGISYEALRDVRNGHGGIRRLTEHAIETALQWEAGSVASILNGGDPVPAVSEPAPVTTTGGITLPSLAVTGDAAAAEDAAEVTRAVVVAAIGPRLERQVWAEVHRHPEGTPASVIFADPVEIALFERDAPELQRIRWIAALRSVDARPTYQARRAG